MRRGGSGGYSGKAEYRMAGQELSGKCNLCGESFPKSGMTNHLKKCRQGGAAAETDGKKRAKKKKAKKSGKASKKGPPVHLLVEGRWLPEYWMHIEMPAGAELYELDDFLRTTWLECCGHMSAFTIGKKRYMSHEVGGWGVWDDEEQDEGMDAGLGEVLRPRMKFFHEYDFGTTTELALKVISMAEGPVGRNTAQRSGRSGQPAGKGVRLLARNDPPPIPCNSCGRPATQVCTECLWEGKGGLCDKCVPKHDCDEEMLLPVVNSPRVGQCGYTGPVEG